MSEAGLGGALIPVGESDLEKWRRFADGLIQNADWTPRNTTPNPGAHSAASRLRSQSLGRREGAKTSLTETLQAMNIKDDMFSPEEHTVLYAVRRSAQFGFHIADEYRTVAGIEDLGDPSRVTAEKRTEMQEKMRTASAVALFSFASYLQHQVVALATENERTHAEHVVLTEVALDQPMVAMKCAVYYLVLSLRNPTVKTAQAAATTIFAFAEKLIGEILQRQDSFEYFKAFSEMSYGLHETETDAEFVVTGFERHDLGSGGSDFVRFEFDDMVGNRDGKHMAKREIQRLVCYNPRAKQNVFMELGGLAGVWMGYGKPGTGKSLMLSCMATDGHDYCQALGMEFYFDPLPDDIIDSYQGKSAQKMQTYMRRRQNPKGIRLMAADDAENVYIDRTHESASEGNRAATGVTLRYLEGAYAKTHGNVSMGFLTNLPEQIDGALRSRIQARVIIDGFVTSNDAMDQLRLWTRQFDDQEGFVNLEDPEGYTYFADQKVLANLGEAAETRNNPEHDAMKDIFASVLREHDPTQASFFGALYVEVMNRFPAFSSRDLRNITSAVDSRIMDFDLPEKWLENPEVFHDQEYDRQREMVLEIRNGNLGNLTFNELLLQESVRYLDNYATIANQAFERKVDTREEQVLIEEAVAKRLAAEKLRTAGKAHAA